MLAVPTSFSVDGSVRVAVGDYGRLRRLVRYLARPAVSTERVEYDRSSGTVTGLQLEEKKVIIARNVMVQIPEHFESGQRFRPFKAASLCNQVRSSLKTPGFNPIFSEDINVCMPSTAIKVV